MYRGTPTWWYSSSLRSTSLSRVWGETIAALDIPGFKVLRWERTGGDFADPSDYPECSVATTGTHDTSTLAEWWTELSPRELTREHRHAILDSLYRSPSRYVILPIQDLFGWRAAHAM